MPWAPSTDFENECVSFQPDHDFIYGTLSDPPEDVHYPRPESHLRFIEEKKKMQTEQNEISSSSKNYKLKIISKVQKIAGTKPLGELPSLEDWDDNTNVERETIGMMRHFGFQPSIEEALDEKCTIATHPLTEEMLVMHNGTKRMPIFYNEKFFKLKSRVPFEFLDEITTEEQNQSMASQSTTDEDGRFIDKSNSKSTASDNHFETPNGSSVKEESQHDSTAADNSFNTACSQSFTSSRSWTRSNEYMNNSVSSKSSKPSVNNDQHRKKWNVLDEEPYFTPKELYLKNRKH